MAPLFFMKTGQYISYFVRSKKLQVKETYAPTHIYHIYHKFSLPICLFCDNKGDQ